MLRVLPDCVEGMLQDATGIWLKDVEYFTSCASKMTAVVAMHAFPANPFAVEDVCVRKAKRCVGVQTRGS